MATSVMVAGRIVVIFFLLKRCAGQVSLNLINERTCFGDNLTFSCEAEGRSSLLWILSAFPGFTVASSVFGQTLSNDVERITSADTIMGPNPSFITILNVTEADNGATVQCRIQNGAISEEIPISIRPLECSLAVNVSAVTDSHITVTWMWTNCKENEPTSISLRWFPTHNSDTAGYISSVPARFEITGLEPNTNYSITASFSDACGNISAMAVAATMPSTIASPPTRSSPTTAPLTTASPATDPSFSDGCGGITAGVAVGCLLLSLLASVATGAITFFCTRRCYKKSSPSPPNAKSVYSETGQSDSVQMQPSPAYESVEKKM